mgnify:CR=1 FL=1
MGARRATDPRAAQGPSSVILLDTHVLIPLSHSAYATVVNPRVNGYVLTPFDVKLIPGLSLQP